MKTFYELCETVHAGRYAVYAKNDLTGEIRRIGQTYQTKQEARAFKNHLIQRSKGSQKVFPQQTWRYFVAKYPLPPGAADSITPRFLDDGGDYNTRGWQAPDPNPFEFPLNRKGKPMPDWER